MCTDSDMLTVKTLSNLCRSLLKKLHRSNFTEPRETYISVHLQHISFLPTTIKED